MATRNIVYSDNEFLRKKCKPVKEFNEALWQLLDDMRDTMHVKIGCGLAAPQVGVLKNVVIVEVNNMFLELINPEVLEEIGIQESLEGCLSVKNIQGYVNRPEQITVKACDRYGDEFVITGTGYLACALSHETDHLKGIIFTDKLIRPYNPEDEKKGKKK